MSKNSIKWTCFFIAITFVFVFPRTHDFLTEWTKLYPYRMGFLKFSMLAFLGELLGIRISNGEWIRPKGIIMRILAWGIMGIAIAFVLPLSYSSNDLFIKQSIFSVTENSLFFQLIQAFIASVVFNILLGPIVIIYHKLAETYIELCEGRIAKLKQIRLSQVIKNVDWVNLVQFVILKVNLIIFIPINTIVFLLPETQRVLLAAYASIILGAVLGYKKRKSRVENLN